MMTDLASLDEEADKEKAIDLLEEIYALYDTESEDN